MAPKSLIVVLSNPVSAERDGEFNAWYESTHIPDILQVSHVEASTRYRVTSAQSLPGTPPYRYLALHEIGSAKVETVIEELRAARLAGRTSISAAYDRSDFFCWYFEPIGERMTAPRSR